MTTWNPSVKRPRHDPDLYVADLYGDAILDPTLSVHHYVPGLLVTGLATLAAAYISERYGTPVVLMSLLVGLALNFLRIDKRLTPGLQLASRALLRIAIVLLGTRITLGQIADFGYAPLASLALVALLSIAAAVLAARWLGSGTPFGVLAGGAVAICGASAALAVYAVLGERRVNRAQLTVVLVGVSAMSSLAMILYPIAAHFIGLSDKQAGFVLGASIHDVAQVLGAGYSYSQPAGDAATVVKLTRVALLAPVLVLVAYFFPGQDGKPMRGIGVPWFVVGFFLVAVINSIGFVPAQVADVGEVAASALLACAVTATGIQAPVHQLLNTGWRPLLPAVAATLTALAVALLFGFALV